MDGLKTSILLICFSILSCTSAFSVEVADSSKSVLESNVTFSLNSNGIASIPAFSLDRPAIIASASLVKGRFSYDPTLAYGLDLRPWFIDNWLHYKLIRKSTFELRAGFNLSSFFTKIELPDETFLTGERYFAFALASTYMLSSNSAITLDYWNDRGQEKASLKGHFISLTGERSNISIGENLLLYGNLMLFYIDYDGKNDGLFVSPKISASVRNLPVSLFFQASQAISSNIDPFPGFRWNVGLSYTL